MPPTPEAHSARYFALLYSPAPQRLVLDALFGIEHEVSESLRPGLDHHVAHSRLQWWREECERAASGRPVHPLTRGLVDALAGAAPATGSAAPAAASAAPATVSAPPTAASAAPATASAPPAAASAAPATASAPPAAASA